MATAVVSFAGTQAVSSQPLSNDPIAYAAALIRQNGGSVRPNYGNIVAQLDALQKNTDPAVSAFGHAVEREIVSQLGGGQTVKTAQVENALKTASYIIGGETFSRSGRTIEATRALAATSRTANNPAYAEYMRQDKAYGDGKWATDDSARINDGWRSMIAANAKTPAEYKRIAAAADSALDSAISGWQTQFSSGNISSAVRESLLRGMTQSDRLSGTNMAQDIGLLLRKGPEMQLAFQYGAVKGVAGAAWGMVSSVAQLAGKAVQYGGDTIGGGIVGIAGDAVRGVIPGWIKDGLNAVGAGQVLDAGVPSYTRGVESTRALNEMGARVREYFATRSAADMGQDVLNALEKKWDSLSEEFKALNGDPVKQAGWLGEQAGAVLFEVASTIVPVTKLGTAAKAADKLVDAARGLDKLDDVADAGRAAGGAESIGATVAKYVRYLGDGPLFRGDTRAPAEIFRDGFRAKGGTDDLADFVANHSDSNFVSTSTSIDVAKRPYYTDGPGGWVYDIDPSRIKSSAIDVNKSLGKHVMDFEVEIAFHGGVPKEAIRSARQVMPDGSLGREVRNPNYIGAE